MSSGSSLRNFLPQEPILFFRIARYACYALVVFAVGALFGEIIFGTLDLFTGAIHQIFGAPLSEMWRESLSFVRQAVRTFALLVSLGVFLTQFE